MTHVGGKGDRVDVTACVSGVQWECTHVTDH